MCQAQESCILPVLHIHTHIIQDTPLILFIYQTDVKRVMVHSSCHLMIN